MSLPRLSIPQFTTTLPSTGTEVLYRAFVVKEEKILLMAAEAKDQKSMITAIKQVLQACIISPTDLKIDKLAFFDIEYLFLQVRAKSIGETVKLSFKHKNGVRRTGEPCDTNVEIEINLETLSPPIPTTEYSNIVLSPTMMLELRYPTLDEIIAISSDKSGPENPNKIFDLLAACVVRVIDGDEVHIPDTKKEALQFIESLPHQFTQDINNFIEHMPTVKLDINYTCTGCGDTEIIALRGLKDFF